MTDEQITLFNKIYKNLVKSKKRKLVQLDAKSSEETMMIPVSEVIAELNRFVSQINEDIDNE